MASRLGEALRRLLTPGRDLDDVGLNGRKITPSDTEELADPCRGIYVGTRGALTVLMWEDTEPVTFCNLAPGIIHPIAVKKVFATGTNCKCIVGVF
jgi:hypothetical protein